MLMSLFVCTPIPLSHSLSFLNGLYLTLGRSAKRGILSGTNFSTKMKDSLNLILFTVMSFVTDLIMYLTLDS